MNTLAEITGSIDQNADDIEEQTSLFDLASVLVRHARTLIVIGLLGAVIGVAPTLWERDAYTAVASFSPEGADTPRAGLSALAGQFGISVPTAGANKSPLFYSDLLKSRVILSSFANDTFVVAEQGGARKSLTELFEIETKSSDGIRESTVIKLSSAISSRVDLNTGSIVLSVTTPWRSVSVAIAERLLNRVNEFNLKTRQSQAANERRFVDGRLAEARGVLREAEDRLERFLASNRQAGSPELTFQRDRLGREVDMRQSVVSTLTQSYEEVRIREVRDTPLITVVEPPAASILPASKNRLLRLLLGGMLGAFAGLVWILFSEMFDRRRRAGDPHLEEFLALLASLRDRAAKFILGREPAQP